MVMTLLSSAEYGYRESSACFQKARSAAHAAQGTTGVIAQLAEIARAEVGQGMLFPLAPDIPQDKF
jgi:hypothetical protein